MQKLPLPRKSWRDMVFFLRWVRDSYPRAYWNADRDSIKNPGWFMVLYFAWRERLTKGGKASIGLLAFLIFLALIPGTGGALPLLAVLVPALVVALVRSVRRVQGLQVHVLAPYRRGSFLVVPVQVENNGDQSYDDVFVSPCRLHEDMHVLAGPMDAVGVGVGDRVEFELCIQSSRRGAYPLRGVVVHHVEPLGLAQSRWLVPCSHALRFPPRAPLVQSFAFLGEGEQGVEFVRVLAGASPERELLGLRAWREGDSFRDLDSRAWARRGEPVAREWGGQAGQGILLAVDYGVAAWQDRCLVDPMLGVALGLAQWLEERSVLGGLYVNGVPVPCPCDSLREHVEASLAQAPRAGYGTFPKPCQDWSCLPVARPTVLVGCGCAMAALPAGRLVKRIQILGGEPTVRSDGARRFLSLHAALQRELCL